MTIVDYKTYSTFNILATEINRMQVHRYNLPNVRCVKYFIDIPDDAKLIKQECIALGYLEERRFI